jgi:hypothetical protein
VPPADVRRPAVDAGRKSSVHTNVAIVAGLSVNVAAPIRIRTGARLHNFAAESLSTSEFFLEAAYRIR